jgi:NAD-dependent deacetylase
MSTPKLIGHLNAAPGQPRHIAPEDPAFAEVGELVRRARRLLVLTGAGISAESGIPTFRSGAGGLWGRHDPMVLATRQGFAADPERVWGWYAWRRAQMRAVQPHAGHFALARYAEAVEQLTVVTQNIDDLHERAGSKDVVHLHGQIALARCIECERPYPLAAHEGEADEDGPMAPPRCPECGDRVRPDVVWFGEPLPRVFYDLALQACANCELALVVGTSGMVQPAASLPGFARQHGATLVQINPEPTELDGSCHFNLTGPASTLLPALLFPDSPV